MAEGRILHGSHEGVQVLRYQGAVRYTLCPALDALIQERLKSEELRGFVVDLTAVDAIDSTNLGILARLTGMMQKRNLPKVTLVSNRPAINEVVEGMGLEKVFHMVSE
ncbi:MAG: STAS domain-containing protein, partial [bacterium]|nr:STAS domain-containing protein [bacterium]